MDEVRRSVGPLALIGGGIAAAVLFVPFTVAHGPTSVNLERQVVGWDMHQWGLVLGTIPPLLVGIGILMGREHIAGGGRASSVALVVMSLTMFLFAAMNLAFRAIGPPFDLAVLAPASVVAALMARRAGAPRVVLGLLAVTYCVGLGLGLLPLESLDSFGGYRIFGIITHAGVGMLWAAMGAILLVTGRRWPVP